MLDTSIRSRCGGAAAPLGRNRALRPLVLVISVPFCHAHAADARAKPDFDAIAGLYELQDGRLLEVFDLIDQMREHQLVPLEPDSGRVRMLDPHPVGDRGISFEGRAGWFAPAFHRLVLDWAARQTDSRAAEW